MVKAKDAIEMARSLIGTPYGSGPGELDCINLIKKVIRTSPGGVRGYKTAGTDALWASGAAGTAKKYKDLTWRQEGLADARPGMLAFKGKATDKTGDGQPHHVGLVAMKGGELSVIHASSANGEVVETPLTEKHGWTLLAVHRYITPEEQTMSNTEVQYAASVSTKSGNLNLRSGPGTAYPVILKIPRGEEVGVIMEYDNGWAFIQYGKASGYAKREFLSTNPAGLPEEAEPKEKDPEMHWYVHVPCKSEAQARALMELIPGAIAVLSGDD